MAMQTISFLAAAEKVAALDALANEQRDRTFILNEAINQYPALQRHRDGLTKQALDSAEAGDVVSHSAVESWAQSLGTDRPLPLPVSEVRFRKS